MPFLGKSITAAALANSIKGELKGNPQASVNSIAALDGAEVNSISFANQNPDNQKIIPNIVLCRKEHAEAWTKLTTVIVVPDPLRALVLLVPQFYATRPVAEGVSAKADIHPSAKLGKNVSIGAFAVIGEGVAIGDNSTIHSHVVIYPGVKIGERCLIHAHVVVREECVIADDVVLQCGAIIGADGFGYIPDPELGLRAVPQIGTVLLEKRVEIGANTCIDRGAFGLSRVGLGTKVDNLVQIGHNFNCGKHCIVCGQSAIAGSVTLGDGVVLGGSVGVSDHISIVSGVRVSARAGVISSITEKGDYAGHPAVPSRQWFKNFAALKKLPDLLRKLQQELKQTE